MNKRLELFKESVAGKKIAVVGIGVSNTPLIKFLRKLGAQVAAFDRKTEKQLGDICSELRQLGVELFLGDEYLTHLNHEIIFKTPGMRYDIPELLEAKAKGSTITSEMEVFFDLCPAQIIGVTGSDGKTTTTTLIYKILQQEGYICWLGGNIGKPLLSEIENILPQHKVVLELSSFQLHTMKVSPDIAVITNLTPNHLDVHKSMNEYVEAKKNIFIHQSNRSKLVINYDNDVTRSFAEEAKGKVLFFSRLSDIHTGVFIEEGNICVGTKAQKVVKTDEIILPGVHNIENYMAAIGAVWEMVSVDSIRKVATTFTGVEHRIEYVREVNGVKFYNDSIASSPTRTIAGLNSFKQKVILIAGGYDKQIPFDELGPVVVERVKKLVLIGKTADKIEQAVRQAYQGNEEMLPIVKCIGLEQAVQEAYQGAEAGDVVILSPACASFDMFKNFAERGNRYKEIIKGL